MITQPASEDASPEEHADERRALRRATYGVIAVGLLIQIFLGARSWIGGDQVTLLRLGEDFAATGHLHPIAKAMSGGGAIPGSLLQILIGLPLMIWRDYHAPLIMIGLFDLAAVLLLVAVAREALGERFALLFAVLYWLSPWRTYHSGFLWEPTFIFLPAALHLWSCWKLRDRAAFLPSMLLAASLVWAVQIHGSFLVLVIITPILLLRRRIRLGISGAVVGMLLGGLTLVPTLLAWLDGTLPSSLPREGFIGYGLVKVAPLLKGVIYWFRLGSLDIGDPLKQTVFLDSGWRAAHSWGNLAAIGVYILWSLLVLTIALSIWCSWWFFRSRRVAAPDDAREASRAWIRDYAGAALIALLCSAALAPFTLQGWHVIVALHAACMPAAVWGVDHWEKVTGRFRPVVAGIIVLQIATIVVVGFGNAIFRFDATPRELGERGNLEVLRPILPKHPPK